MAEVNAPGTRDLTEYNRMYYQANKPKRTAQHKAYYAANKEKILQQQREYRAAKKLAARQPLVPVPS